MNRGDRKKDIYFDDVDQQDFLKTLAEACQKSGFPVHAYCLMRNHFEERDHLDDSGNCQAASDGELEEFEQ